MNLSKEITKMILDMLSDSGTTEIKRNDLAEQLDACRAKSIMCSLPDLPRSRDTLSKAGAAAADTLKSRARPAHRKR